MVFYVIFKKKKNREFKFLGSAKSSIRRNFIQFEKEKNWNFVFQSIFKIEIFHNNNNFI